MKNKDREFERVQNVYPVMSELPLYFSKSSWCILIGRSVSPHAGRTPSKGVSIPFSGKYKYSYPYSQRLYRGQIYMVYMIICKKQSDCWLLSVQWQIFHA